MTDKKFQQALQSADRIMQDWPLWKQNSLLVSSMSTTPAPREPIPSVALNASTQSEFEITGPISDNQCTVNTSTGS